MKQRDEITIVELTCPFETNIDNAHAYKQEKYKNLRNELITPVKKFNLICLEISSLGFVGQAHTEFIIFVESLKLEGMHIIKKCQEVAIRTSFYIYCRRNKTWEDPVELSYT